MITDVLQVRSVDQPDEAGVRREQAAALVAQEVLSDGNEVSGSDSCGARTDEAGAIISRLADSAAAFILAIQDLARQGSGWSSALRTELTDLQSRFEELAQAASEQKALNSAWELRYQQLSAGVAVVRESDARQEAEIGLVREQARRQLAGVSARLEQLGAQWTSHQEEFSRLQSTVSALASKVGTWCERLDRQGDVLRSLCELQTQRAAALGQLLEVIHQLRTFTLVPEAVGF